MAVWCGRKEVPDRSTKPDDRGTRSSQLFSHYTRAYLRTGEDFARYFKRSLDQLPPDHIRQYQAHLFRESRLSPNSVTQRLGALRFFYIKTLKQSSTTSRWAHVPECSLDRRSLSCDYGRSCDYARRAARNASPLAVGARFAPPFRAFSRACIIT
jgi:hypothetical protein